MLVEDCQKINITTYIRQAKAKLKGVLLTAELEMSDQIIELTPSKTAFNGLRYWFQNRPNCRFSSRQRMSRTFCAPATPQNMPDCLSRRPMTVLQPASTTPEPMNKPRALYLSAAE